MASLIGWHQQYLCKKCMDILFCPGDVDLWDWIRSDEVLAFEAKHAVCDDGMSVGATLIIMDPGE